MARMKNPTSPTLTRNYACQRNRLSGAAHARQVRPACGCPTVANPPANTRPSRRGGRHPGVRQRRRAAGTPARYPLHRDFIEFRRARSTPAKPTWVCGQRELEEENRLYRQRVARGHHDLPVHRLFRRAAGVLSGARPHAGRPPHATPTSFWKCSACRSARRWTGCATAKICETKTVIGCSGWRKCCSRAGKPCPLGSGGLVSEVRRQPAFCCRHIPTFAPRIILDLVFFQLGHREILAVGVGEIKSLTPPHPATSQSFR